MRSKKVFENPTVYQISVPNPPTLVHDTNAYLVMSEGETLLVDTGAAWDEGLEYLRAALDELGVDRGKLDVLATHFHSDHTGLIDSLDFGGRLYVSRLEAKLWSGEERAAYLSRAEHLCHNMGMSSQEAAAVVGLVNESVVPPDMRKRDTVFVDVGDKITVGAITFGVHVFPGHTPGGIALYLAEKNLVISGDLIVFDVTPAIALPDREHDYLLRYFGSAERLSHLLTDVTLPGHGIVQGDPGERMEWILEHHRRRLQRAEDIIREQPGLNGMQVVEGLHWNIPRGDSPIAKRAALLAEIAGISYLNALVTSGRVQGIKGDDKVWHFSAE